MERLLPRGDRRGAPLQPLSATETEDVLHFLYEASTVVAAEDDRSTSVSAGWSRNVQAIPESCRRGAAACTVRSRARSSTLFGSEQVGLPAPTKARRRTPRPPLAVGCGRGVVFVSHAGEVSPSGFLPVVVGNVRESPLTDIYRSAPLLWTYATRTGSVGGAAGASTRTLCGDSRARAYATYRDPLAEDPACPYVPATSFAE